jgi:hypothetical protein
MILAGEMLVMIISVIRSQDCSVGLGFCLDGRIRSQFLAQPRDFTVQSVQTGSGTHCTSYSKDIEIAFLWSWGGGGGLLGLEANKCQGSECIKP